MPIKNADLTGGGETSRELIEILGSLYRDNGQHLHKHSAVLQGLQKPSKTSTLSRFPPCLFSLSATLPKPQLPEHPAAADCLCSEHCWSWGKHPTWAESLLPAREVIKKSESSPIGAHRTQAAACSSQVRGSAARRGFIYTRNSGTASAGIAPVPAPLASFSCNPNHICHPEERRKSNKIKGSLGTVKNAAQQRSAFVCFGRRAFP